MKTIEERVDELEVIAEDFGNTMASGVDASKEFCDILDGFRRHLTEHEEQTKHKEREWAIVCVRRYHADMVQKLAKGEQS